MSFKDEPNNKDFFSQATFKASESKHPVIEEERRVRFDPTQSQSTTMKAYPRDILEESMFDDTNLLSSSTPAKLALGRDNIRRQEATTDSKVPSAKKKKAVKMGSSSMRGNPYAAAAAEDDDDEHNVSIYHKLQPSVEDIAMEN